MLHVHTAGQAEQAGTEDQGLTLTGLSNGMSPGTRQQLSKGLSDTAFSGLRSPSQAQIARETAY